MSEAARKLAYLEAMGIDVWVARNAVPAEAEAQSESLVGLAPSAGVASDISQRAPHGWEELAAQVRDCTACALREKATQTVFGVGNRDADWLVIGEAPGAEEDQQGEPFVGRAGKLLNNMLLAIGLKREQVYITNVVKCRPPGNRDPRPEEAASCAAYLRQQIELIQPKIILVVGRIAAQNLLNTTQSLAKLRGQTHRYADTQIPLVITYHPAYLLRSPTEKRKAWEDLKYAVSVYQKATDSQAR